ncbi:MAG: hypothetical protein M1120_03300 [Patescibacteria group bacterium]|nr:hypothetical protein [Patescibacteria group bacterium]
MLEKFLLYTKTVDFIILGTDKKDLQKILLQITAFLAEHLKLELHPRKVRLFPSCLGVDFVGYVIFPDHVRLRSKNVRRFKKKLKKMTANLEAGQISQAFFHNSLQSWVAHAKHADAFRLRQRLFASSSLRAFSPTPLFSPRQTPIAPKIKNAKGKPSVKAPVKPANQYPVQPVSSDVQLSLFDDWRG